MSYILVTGGAGYIGSHTVIELVKNNYKVIIVDNLSNSSYDAVARIEYITSLKIPFFNVDLRNHDELTKVFKQYPISGVIHFAALKAVGESSKIPLKYYDNNINGTINLLTVMKENSVTSVVFSSSATVYGDVTRFPNNEMIPIPEHCPMDPTNPYGRTKFMIETILKDVHASESSWKVAILRYFNPIGAHPSGLLGEDPLGIPNNLLPYLAQVAIGRRDKLSVFGNDYDSHDGTPIRDYIHVVDLAKGHISALKYLDDKAPTSFYREWNLGTGKGSTVFEVYNSFCRAVGEKLPFEIASRRAGDVLNLTANPSRAHKELEWKTEFDIDIACKDLWKWTKENPFGFRNEGYEWKIFSDNSETDYTNRLHTITTKNLKVSIANYGALIHDIQYKGQSVVAKFPSIEGYQSSTNPYFGTSVGRCANRISGASFTLDDKVYNLTQNENGNNLHGGKNGFDKKFFYGPVVRSEEKNGCKIYSLEFSVRDEDGNDGFPGDLDAKVKYIIDDDSIVTEYEGKLVDQGVEKEPETLGGKLSSKISNLTIKEKPTSTIINLTNHSYFNITGDANFDGTNISMLSNKYLEINQGLPSGKIVTDNSFAPLEPFCLTNRTFDDCFIVSPSIDSVDTRAAQLKTLVEITHPKSPMKLSIASTEPSFQLYTGDGVNTDGFGARCGFCVEPTRYVDAINSKEWRDQVILSKGEVYGSLTKYSFCDV